MKKNESVAIPVLYPFPNDNPFTFAVYANLQLAL